MAHLSHAASTTTSICVRVCVCLPSRMQIVQSVCKQLFQKFMNILCAACLPLCVCVCVYLCVCASSIQLANVQVSHCLCCLHISYCCETWYFCILSHAARITNDKMTTACHIPIAHTSTHHTHTNTHPNTHSNRPKHTHTPTNSRQSSHRQCTQHLLFSWRQSTPHQSALLTRYYKYISWTYITHVYSEL